MNPRKQIKHKQLEKQFSLQFFISDSNLIQNQTAAVHVSSTSRNITNSKGLHNLSISVTAKKRKLCSYWQNQGKRPHGFSIWLLKSVIIVYTSYWWLKVMWHMSRDGWNLYFWRLPWLSCDRNLRSAALKNIRDSFCGDELMKFHYILV